MSIPPLIVAITRKGWKCQWRQLMKGLGPADKSGTYKRIPSQKINALVPKATNLLNRPQSDLPALIIGRSCPWAHRTWLVYKIRGLEDSLKLIIAKADHQGGRWIIEPSWLECNSLLDIYKLCRTTPNARATVPALIDPKPSEGGFPQLVGNESTQLVEALNKWPGKTNAPNLSPENLQADIKEWESILQEAVNNGVYKCGFARNQKAYEMASEQLFNALNIVEESLSQKGPWLCGETLTLADIRLFPTLIRWEAVYEKLFKCTQKPLWLYPKIWDWRKRMYQITEVSNTCDSNSWRNDYFGALFPLNPSNIIPKGTNLTKIINSSILDN